MTPIETLKEAEKRARNDGNICAALIGDAEMLIANQPQTATR